MSNTKTYGRQMGDKWIRGNLIDAVDEDMYYDILEAMGEGNVGSYLFNIQKNDQVDLIMLRNGKKVK